MKVFRDPVHDLIVVPDEDSFILDLLKTSEVQRLRRIRQLGVSCLVYQGAEHTRFTHSLGVYHCVRRVLAALCENQQCDKEVTETVMRIAKPVKAAALLHDLGHGPFSHVFERFSNVNHEAVTHAVVSDGASHIGQILEAAGIPAESVAGIINKTSTESLAVDILSSELDADRMDYLLRDSHMCGVTYGLFDIEWMMHVMRATKIPSIHVDKLAADATRGVCAIEQYVLARIHMYEQVYFHKTTRGYEGLLLNLLKCAKMHVQVGWDGAGADPYLIEFLKTDHPEPAAILGLDDFSVLRAIVIWSQLPDTVCAPLPYLAKRFTFRDRPLRCIPVEQKSQIDFGALRQELSGRDDLNWLWHADQAGSTYYKGVLYNLDEEKDQEEEANTTIFVLDRNKPAPVESKSLLLKRVGGEEFDRVRFYYDGGKEQDFSALLRKHKIST